MAMPAVGCLAIFMFVNRNPAIIVMMMLCIHADLRRIMGRFVNHPCRNRNAHAERQPDKREQAQQRSDRLIHHVGVGDAEKLGNLKLSSWWPISQADEWL